MDEKSCVTPAGTSNKPDVQNKWEETNTHAKSELLQYTSYGNIPNCCNDMYGCVCVVIPFILDVSCGRTGTGFLRLPSAVLALIFIAKRIQPSLSFVNREVEFCVPTN